MRRLSALVFVSALIAPLGAQQQAPADLIVTNARIYTVDDAHPLADAMAVRGGKIMFVGDTRGALTLKGTDAPARADFERRLLTLSAVHSLLTDENWNGVQLHALVRASLKTHFDSDRERVRYTGEDFRLRPKSALALSIALHELGTNAVKYGALSTPEGSVSVSWTLAADRFRLCWEEEGGPPVTPPARSGFGTRMIERGLAAELHGDARIDYRPQGVVCILDAPLGAIRESSADKGMPT